MNWLVRGTGLRLLYNLNLQQRFGQNWDPTNTAELMDFSTALQMGESVDFELGNGKFNFLYNSALVGNSQMSVFLTEHVPVLVFSNSLNMYICFILQLLLID